MRAQRQRPDDIQSLKWENPFFVGEFVAHDSAPSVRALNHGSVVRLNGAPTDWDLVAMRPEADALCSP